DNVIMPLTFTFIILVGVLGNGILVTIVAVNKNMRSTPNILLVSLAIGDLLLLIFSVPFQSVRYAYMSWPFGLLVCKFSEFSVTLSLGVTVFTLTVLSWERSVAAVAVGRDGVAVVGVVAVLRITYLSIISFFASINFSFQGKTICSITNPKYFNSILSWFIWHHCYCLRNDDVTYDTLTHFLIFFIFPIIVISIFYGRMAAILIQSSKNIPGDQIEARKKVAKIVLSCIVIFSLCWLPHHIYQIAYSFSLFEYNRFWHWFKIVGICTSYMNSCVNPIALYFLSKQFRRYYDQYF
ncbi:hypothetical protein HELRODRAFT_140466, partial [Helobdella robusta]|uniref:G-protein coupled receptors family 1 profile domain-containing protein n=1 Tax=Helobdella robusta TaxID=6412 RepID=T1EJ11_HELRO